MRISSARKPDALLVSAALATGALLWAASPGVGAGWLAWLAPVPAAYVALARAGTRAGRLAVPLAYAVYLELLFVPALPFGLADGQWGDPALPVLVGDSPVVVVALVAVPLFAALLYLVRFGSPPRPPGRAGAAGAAGAVLVPAAAWTVLDFARASLDPGGAWGPLFLSQHDQPAAAATALAGPWLLTFAIAAAAYSIALAAVRRRPAPVAAAAAGLLALFAATALERSLRADPERSIHVAAVQPGYDTAEDGRPELRYFKRTSYGRAALDTIRDLGVLTRTAARRGARVVVWPEATLWVQPDRHRVVRERLAALAREAEVTLVVPYFLRDPDRGAALAVTVAGRFSAERPKQRPMWFLGEHGGGAPPRPLDAGSLSVGTLLGVDNQAPAVAARLAGERAELTASSTHDWPQLADQQRALARLHAEGTGTALVRADWRYGSAIYDRGGRIVADAGTGLRRTVVAGEVALAAAPTPYARIGDAFAWGCVGFLVVLLGGRLAMRVRASTGGRIAAFESSTRV